MKKHVESLLNKTNAKLTTTCLRPLVKYNNQETWSYVIMGGLTTVIGFGSYVLFAYLGLNTALSNTLSTILATLFAFVTNKMLVFRTPSWCATHVVGEFAKFCVARFFTFALETILLVLLVDMLGLHNAAMKAISMIMVITGNYALSKWLVFTQK